MINLDVPMTIIQKVEMIDYAKRFIGTSYVYGGDTAEEGFDCSGYAQEVLASQGYDPRHDQTAQALFNILSKGRVCTPAAINMGDILFFGKSIMSITHVAIASNHELMLEAGGEGSVATTKGSVRIRPISNRKDLVAVLSL